MMGEGKIRGNMDSSGFILETSLGYTYHFMKWQHQEEDRVLHVNEMTTSVVGVMSESLEDT